MTRIIADTTCGLSAEQAEVAGIPLISQIINFGEESFREGIDIDYAGFMSRLLSSRRSPQGGKELPKTSAPYPGDFIAAFEPIIRQGESIICIHPSADVSGTVRSAEIARDAFPGSNIRIIDTRTVCGPLASLVMEANRLAQAGAGADEVEGRVREMLPRARIYFLVNTLEFLQRGGRIGGAAALVGSILQIKPILAFIDGRVEPLERERTKRRALIRLKELVSDEAARGNDARLSIMHSAAPAEAAVLASELGALLQTSEAPISNLAPAIVTHVGPGALAVGFFAKA